MGKVVSTLIRRPAKNWNIENRAQSFLNKQDKPHLAPKHPSTKDAIDSFIQDHPEIQTEVKKKDENLSKMLKGLVVEPERMGQIVSKSGAPRRLPEDRSKRSDPEFGYLEPEVIRPGRCSIRQALDFLTDHANDPNASGSAEMIAQRYNMDVHRVRVVLRYYHVFNIHLPKKLAEKLPASVNNTKLLHQGVSPEQESSDSDKKDDGKSNIVTDK